MEPAKASMNGRRSAASPLLTRYHIAAMITTAKVTMKPKIPTTRFSSRFPLSCAWAVPVVDRRPAGERRLQDAARFKALNMQVRYL
jgi:hypothetical protein